MGDMWKKENKLGVEKLKAPFQQTKSKKE